MLFVLKLFSGLKKLRTRKIYYYFVAILVNTMSFLVKKTARSQDISWYHFLIIKFQFDLVSTMLRHDI